MDRQSASRQCRNSYLHGRLDAGAPSRNHQSAGKDESITAEPIAALRRVNQYCSQDPMGRASLAGRAATEIKSALGPVATAPESIATEDLHDCVQKRCEDASHSRRASAKIWLTSGFCNRTSKLFPADRAAFVLFFEPTHERYFLEHCGASARRRNFLRSSRVARRVSGG